MSRLEALDGTNWEAFLAAPATVLVLTRSDCPTCGAWLRELQAFLEVDRDWRDVRFGVMVLDRGGLASFKRAHDWVAELRGLPYTLVSADGEPLKDFVGEGVEHLEAALHVLRD